MTSSEEGLQIAISPVQLAAVLTHESLSATEVMMNRVWGSARILGGVVELMGAGVLCAAPDPTLATKAGCVFVGVHGTDTLLAGMRQVSTGRPSPSLTEHGVKTLAKAAGANDATAETIALAVDVSVSIASAVAAGAVRVASVRAGTIDLALHEATVGSRVGGHTISTHIGKTEAELRARLVAYPRLSAASTFASHRTAEAAISKILRDRASIVSVWARDAAQGSTLRLAAQMPSVTGYGVVRATGRFVPMRGVLVVLRRESYNGMPYFILTAFPTL